MIERSLDELVADVESRTVDVRAIVDDVRRNGDAALERLAQRFGDPPPRAVASSAWAQAYRSLPGPLRGALDGAAERIGTFARAQRDALGDVAIASGGLQIGHRAIPIGRAGIYVPAGRHPLPSSLLMAAIPARIAGVRERIVCTPRADTLTLAAAHVAGVDALFEIGGAQAIAALAYGTASVPRVDLIVGPGNAYVTAAKRAVFGSCGIDALAGPSEILIVASGDADVECVAADLLAQAEHDDDARALLVTDDRAFAQAVGTSVERRLAGLETAETARRSMERRGGFAIVPLGEAPALCDRIAPEHLSLQGARAEQLEGIFSVYGTIFVGSGAAEVLGDYGSGPNHVLPTGGSARFSSGLSVFTFLTIRTYERAGTKSDRRIVNDAAILASAEGLAAHRDAALVRLT